LDLTPDGPEASWASIRQLTASRRMQRTDTRNDSGHAPAQLPGEHAAHRGPEVSAGTAAYNATHNASHSATGTAAAAAAAPGRSCPLHYRYDPGIFAADAGPGWQGLDVLYVVGGLYGNELALQQVQRLFERERGRKRLVFNGDFHWFDIDPAVFDRVQRGVLAHAALRGNVETELGDDSTTQGEAGCGCAYPAWVGDAVVQRSNRILGRLRAATTAVQRRVLAGLPMGLRADVGPLRLGIVHGDAQSLAGWGFAQEALRDPASRDRARRWFGAAGVEAFASSHTCLPVFQPLRVDAARTPRWILNNGAAGMPNFRADGAGLLTRIGVSPHEGGARRAGIRAGEVFCEALAIEVDAADARRRFLAQWPPGSDAHASYFDRIVNGPAYGIDEMIRPVG
jgi:hypothetical protein